MKSKKEKLVDFLVGTGLATMLVGAIALEMIEARGEENKIAKDVLFAGFLLSLLGICLNVIFELKKKIKENK
jgi:hypothetical protein